MHILSRGKKYKLSDDAKEKRLSYHRQYMKTHYNKDKQKDKNLRSNHGITLDEYNAMIDKQGGACAICKEKFHDRHGMGVHVDHDHKTGKVRGILCRKCNLLLGQASDNVIVLMSAIEYLS